MRIKEISIAPGGTHHELAGQPLYPARFLNVLKFHPPALAAVLATDGAYHIGVDGTPAYSNRFAEAFGFYQDLAAVRDSSGWFHIRVTGEPLYSERYAWCGNYQNGRVPVRDERGQYFHLDVRGRRAYGANYLYAGDYRDGIACVRRHDGLCIHIDLAGGPIHATACLDLDVFHKGYARARDERGWFHLRLDGSPAYTDRFAEVEPFYNGQALGRDWAGRRVIVSENGRVIHTVWDPTVDVQGTGNKGGGRFIVIVGNCGAGKTTLARGIASRLSLPLCSIDDFRRTCSDGSPAGEVRAWQRFLESLADHRSTGAAIEFSGSGHMAHLVRLALQEAGDYSVLWIRTPVEVCLARAAQRPLDVPYPGFGWPIEKLIPELHERLERELTRGDIWPMSKVSGLDGTGSPASLLEAALKHLEVPHD